MCCSVSQSWLHFGVLIAQSPTLPVAKVSFKTCYESCQSSHLRQSGLFERWRSRFGWTSIASIGRLWLQECDTTATNHRIAMSHVQRLRHCVNSRDASRGSIAVADVCMHQNRLGHGHKTSGQPICSLLALSVAIAARRCLRP